MMLKCGEKNNINYTFGKVEVNTKKIKKASGNFCTACGTKLAPQASYCSKCGSPI